jgi:drug/metabolite transporter (DMT)-like permease
VAAIALAVGGFGLQVAALGSAPLTVVQPVLALGLLLLLVLGARVLGERVGPRQVAAVLAIVAGVTGMVVAAPPRSSASDATATAVALFLLGAAVLAPFALRPVRVAGGVVLALSAGAADAVAALAAKLLSNELSAGRPLLALAWAAAAGGAVLLGLLSELSALQRIPATRLAPVVLVMQVVIPVLLAPLLTGESWKGTPLGGGLLVASLAAVAAGAAVLGSSRAVGGLLAGDEG